MESTILKLEHPYDRLNRRHHRADAHYEKRGPEGGTNHAPAYLVAISRAWQRRTGKLASTHER